MSMLLVPIGMYWVAETLMAWSGLRHAQALDVSWTGRGLVGG
jgi:hypothetical protein